MASVRKFAGSKYWTACYFRPNGEREQKSTKLTDKATAEQIAETWEKPFRQLQTAKWIRGCTRKICREADAIAGIEDTICVPARQWLMDWLERTSHVVSENTATIYRRTITEFLQLLGPRADEPLADIKPADVSAWLNDMVIGKGVTEGTANTRLIFLSGAMNEAVRIEVIAKNPCKGLRFKGADKKRQKRSAFTLAQFRALIDACAADPKLSEWHTLLLVLGLTGARQQEAAQLNWGQIDFAQDRITLVRGKQHDQRHVLPMAAQLRAHLALVYERKTAIMVMPGIAARDNKWVSKTFRTQILPRIGIKEAFGQLEEGKRGGKKLVALTLHSLRHSLASWLDETGSTPAQRRDVLGHGTAEINERYTHANLEQIAAAIDRVSEAMEKAKA
jgi:integrase